MMSNKKAGWKLMRTKNTLYEEVEGRRHNWHFHPEIFPDATTYMVKVRVSPGEGHDFHVHPQMDEILYVLRGCAEQWIEDEKVEMEEGDSVRSEEHTSELQSRGHLVCRLLLEK